jgi:GxxExxY protein
MEMNELTSTIIAAAIEVHRTLGPVLLESAYKICLRHELSLRGVPASHEIDVPVEYKGIRLDCGYRLDILVDELMIVEAKAVDRLHPVHEAQVITCLRLTGKHIGLPMNFNAPTLKDGLKRIVLDLPE